MPPIHTDVLWRLAAAKSAEIQAKSPDLAPALALQRRLLGLLFDASSHLDDTVSLGLGQAAISDKWARGVPALRNETIPIPPVLGALLPPVCTALADGGAGDAARHIGSAIVAGTIDAASLLNVSLQRNQEAIRTSALHMGFSPDLVWLIGELGSAPLAHHLQHHVVGSDPRTGTGVRPQDWDRGYCPVCGSWPAFIESVEGTRALRCSYCALSWTLQSRRCIYCGNAGDDFVAAALDIGAPGQRVELCGSCGLYTKVIDAAEPTPFPLLAIDDLGTMHLDRGAMDRGYRRPALVSLDAIEPRISTC